MGVNPSLLPNSESSCITLKVGDLTEILSVQLGAFWWLRSLWKTSPGLRNSTRERIWSVCNCNRFLHLYWKPSVQTFVLWSRQKALSDRSVCTKIRFSSNFCRMQKMRWGRVCSHMNFPWAGHAYVHTSVKMHMNTSKAHNGWFDLKFGPFIQSILKKYDELFLTCQDLFTW